MIDLRGRSPDYCQGYFEARKELLDEFERIITLHSMDFASSRAYYRMLDKIKELEQGGKE